MANDEFHAIKTQFMKWVNNRNGPHDVFDFDMLFYKNIKSQIYALLIDEFCPYKFQFSNETCELDGSSVPQISDIDDKTAYIYAVTNGDLHRRSIPNMTAFVRDRILHINDKKIATMLVIAGYKKIE